MSRMTQRQRPVARPFYRPQRPDDRGNAPFGGEQWGSANWPVDTADTAADLTPEIFGVIADGGRIAPFANLAALQADGTYGDGNLSYNSGADFAAGEFVYLRDGSQANYASSAWSSGVHV